MILSNESLLCDLVAIAQIQTEVLLGEESQQQEIEGRIKQFIGLNGRKGFSLPVCALKTRKPYFSVRLSLKCSLKCTNFEPSSGGFEELEQLGLYRQALVQQGEQFIICVPGFVSILASPVFP